MAHEPKFTLRKNTNGKDGLIMLRFSYFKKRLQVSTGFTVPLKYWNPASGRLKEVQGFKDEAKGINARLDSLARGTTKLFFEYASKGEEFPPTVQRFKEDWLKLFRPDRTGEEEKKPLGLLDFIRAVIAERERLNWKKSTLGVYNNCVYHLEEYQKATGKALTFEGLNKAFLTDFVAYLYGLKLSNSYSKKLVSTLKTFARLAKETGTIQDSPILEAKNPVKKPQHKDTVYLNERELEKLESLELEGRLANVRDLFLLGCLTGQRFSDFSQIKPENIQPVEYEGKSVTCLVLTQQKTGQKVTIPLTNPTLWAILERHGWQAPRAISGQKFNDYLKELAQLAGFTQEVEISEYKEGQQKKKTFQKYQLISSHTARRSFCTNAYKRGLNPATIIKFSGHKDVKTLLTYIRATGEETAVELAEHAFFTGKAPLKVAK